MTTSSGRRTPRADCIADSAGGITFDIAGLARPGAALVLRRRGGTATTDTVRLPLTPTGTDRSRAVLPSTMELAEGHWDAHTDDDTAVESGIRDLRSLIDRVPDAGRVAARVPYPTTTGRLAVRSWVREPHAEAGDITFEQGACTVRGALYGAEPGDGASVEARSGDTTHRAAAACAGGEFSFTLSFSTLAGEPDGMPTGTDRQWTLWLQPAAGAEPVRISRILDDVWDRRNVYVYPVHETEGYRAVPCYNAENDLCIRLTAPAVADGAVSHRR
ncbi:hypothetical protein [Streptomyces sp. NPDC059176]|uniref:hypothetical protein n=1 Tax=unclassified Streptomyces TaxID=2593676 RepID=UPI0036B678F3